MRIFAHRGFVNGRVEERENNPLLFIGNIRSWTVSPVWHSIHRPKLDLSGIGDWRGSGIVDWTEKGGTDDSSMNFRK